MSSNQNNQSNNDFISVILPVRNEVDNIVDTVNQLMSQNYPADKFELIIVDDQSTDLTYEYAVSCKAISDSISVLKINNDEKRIGKKAAISKGVIAAKGDIIVTTDADCKFGTSWLSSLVSPLRNEKINMVLGKVEIDPEQKMFSTFQHIEFATLIGLTGASVAMNKPLLANGANLAFRKNIYNEVGDFEIKKEGFSGDDVFLMQKINEKFPHSIHFNKDEKALVITRAKKSWKGFINQRKRWISKVGKYKSKFALRLGLFILIVNIILLILLLNAIVFFRVGEFLIFFIAKLVVDFLFINSVTKKINAVKLFLCVFKFEFVYIYYLLRLITFNKKNISWKGRDFQ